jgi:type VI secretion system VgrG family protein
VPDEDLLRAIAAVLGLPESLLPSSELRLYHLEGSGSAADIASRLLVEAWWMHEALDDLFRLEVTCLSVDPVDLDGLLGQPLRLRTTLADGSAAYRSGFVCHAQTLDADGGLYRHRFALVPWPWLLDHRQGSAVWQERPFTAIIEDAFGPASAVARWKWSEDCSDYLQQSNSGGLRSYITQYRESPWRFAMRQLASEGIGLRFEESDDAPQNHQAVLFSDSPGACPEDPSSAADGGIRFHRASSQEEADTIQAFGQEAQFLSASTTVLSWDYKAKRALAATVPTPQLAWGPDAPQLEEYELPGAYAFSDALAAEHYAKMRRERTEARMLRYAGHGTVRTFRAGTTFSLSQSLLDLVAGGSPQRFLLTEVVSVGVNNLPVEMQRALAERWWHAGADAELLPADLDPQLVVQVQKTGYANRFGAIPAQTPWRPALRAKPQAPAATNASVVGPNGETSANGPDEIHCDGLGRIRIAFHWQRGQRPDDRNSCWVRVVQPFAGPGYGTQFLPRIGHEVLVGYIDGDIDRPIVRASLYSGRGEGGLPATPGGQGAEADATVFGNASDSRPSGQGNLTGGNSPAWHGAAAEGHANQAALSGIKTREFGGTGYNQLVFDDTDNQLRAQFGTTQYATWLNLGHLIHQADNYRGSFRGLGFELRTDAWGAVRTKSGMLVTTYSCDEADPAGDNAAGQALAAQMLQLAQSFNQAAQTHQTVQLASFIGSNAASACLLSDSLAPLRFLKQAVDGMVDPTDKDAADLDALAGNTDPLRKIPHTGQPIITMSARGGIVQTSQDTVQAAKDIIHTAAGQDITRAIGGSFRLHTGQAIGVLAGAVQPGGEAAGTGLSLIAGQGDVNLQAQGGPMQVAAKGLVNVQSANGHIDWAAAKKITLKTEGGACIEISGGGVTVMAPGKIEVQAATKAMEGGANAPYAMPQLPHQVCLECLLKAMRAGGALASA